MSSRTARIDSIVGRMITRELLRAQCGPAPSGFSIGVPTAKRHVPAGYYPNGYRVGYDAQPRNTHSAESPPAPDGLHPEPDLALKLAALVDTSRSVAATRSRRDKIALLAELFTRVPPDEIELATSYLGGVVRQEKLGLGWAGLQAADASAAPGTGLFDAGTEPPETGVELAELDATLERIARTTGKGSADARRLLLRELLARLGDDERHFLFGLVMGELRQGALDALVIEAVARAAGLPPDDVRRAVMLDG